MKKRQQYTDLFRQEVIGKVNLGAKQAVVAREMGVHESLVSQWVIRSKKKVQATLGKPIPQPQESPNAEISEAIAFVAGRVIEICTITAGRTGVSQRALTERVADLLRRSQNW